MTAPEQPLHDDTQPASLWEDLRRASLSYSGYSYIVGDLLLAVHGVLNKRPDRALTGLSWTVGGLATALYGHSPPEQRLRTAAYDMADHFRAQDVEIPANSHIQQLYLAHRQRFGTQVEQFLYRYPSQILNTVYLGGGILLMRSGIRQATPDKWEFAAGALSVAGAAAGLLLPESTKEPDKPSNTTPLTPQWFLEKPLRLTAGLYGLNNIAMLKSAILERSNGHPMRNFALKLGVTGTYILGDGLLSLSSKHSDNETLTRAATDQLLTMAAEIIRPLPLERHDAIIDELSIFLARHPDITLDRQTLLTSLHSRLAPPTLQLTSPIHTERLSLPDHAPPPLRA